MKTSTFITLAVIISAAFTAAPGLAQTAPSLGTAAGFALFTSVGEFANTGTTAVTGDIGNGAGAVTGDAVTVTGNTHFGDVQGVAATLAVAAAYAQLTNPILNPCGNTLTSPIGGGATFAPGVYCSTTATVLTGDLTLDAGGDPNAIFIIKIDGALSVTAPVNIILTDGASLQNVYWQVNGAVSLDAGSAFKGTVINVGAISLASGASISGRAFSTAGKISLNNNIVSNEEVVLPVTLVAFTVKKGENQTALLYWATTAETNSDRFEVEHSSKGKIWKEIATVTSKGESRELMSYSFTDTAPEEGNNLYRLKMIDKDESFTYSSIRSISINSKSKTALYPNPTTAQLILEVSDISKIERVQFNDMSGKLILDQKRSSLSDIRTSFNVNNFLSGLYIVKVTHTNGSVDVMKIVKR
ncbi:ice-binding family protein [Dyadobacter endophyticus]|uniref:ice-binding family protein n=1 Tax=Dyadobacter TaxID=120831 RepID=UPI003CF4F4D5